MTPIQTLHRALCKRFGDTLGKLPNISMIQKIRKPQIRIHDIGIQKEEIFPNSAQTRVLIAERGYKHCRFAVIVELEMDASLGEYRALILRQGRAHLRLEAILQ